MILKLKKQPFMRIGNKIRTLRLLKNYSIDTLANHLEMSSSNFGKIERNEIDLNLEKAQKLSAFFGITIDELKNFNEGVSLNVTEKKGQVGYIQHISLPETEKERYEKEILFLKEQITKKDTLIEGLLKKISS